MPVVPPLTALACTLLIVSRCVVIVGLPCISSIVVRHSWAFEDSSRLSRITVDKRTHVVLVGIKLSMHETKR